MKIEPEASLTAPFFDFLTIRAFAKYFKNMRSDLVAIFNGYRFLQFFNQAHVEVYAAAAVIANDVMVVLSRLDKLVATFSISQVYCLNEPERYERFQGAVYGCKTWCAKVFSAQLTVNILSAAQILCFLQNFENTFAALRKAFILHYWRAMFVGHRKSFLDGFQALA